MKQMPNRALIVIGAALALGIGGGVAVAQIPSSTDGTITACMTTPAGTIRLIDAQAGATCKKSEKKVTWSEAGQPGTDGVSGYEMVSSTSPNATVPPGGGGGYQMIWSVACPEGKVATGGGGYAEYKLAADSGFTRGDITASTPDPAGQSWSIEAQKQDGTGFAAGDIFRTTVHVFCINAS